MHAIQTSTFASFRKHTTFTKMEMKNDSRTTLHDVSGVTLAHFWVTSIVVLLA
jgi:hypothetical protein